MNGESHHSFKELFETKSAQELPFNQAVDHAAGGAGEFSTFISIPIKRNARTVPNSSIKNVFKTLLLNSSSNHSEYAQQEGNLQDFRFAFLDFKAALLPHIDGPRGSRVNHDLHLEQNDAKNNSQSSGEKDQFGLEEYYFPNADSDAILLQEETPSLHFTHLPTPSQWYIMNQLRIHAGTPERSMAGIDKLAQYYAQLQYLEQKFPFDTEDVSFHVLKLLIIL